MLARRRNPRISACRRSVALAIAACASVLVAGASRAAESQAAAAAPKNPVEELHHEPSRRTDRTAKAVMHDMTKAGRRLVAVGDYGIVLLSDDDGRTFRQARASPTRVTLNAVSFAGDREGWIAGHRGVVLHTEDGGETWSIQRSDASVDQPLFSIWFEDAKKGFAAGLWSLLLKTGDGGKTWEKVTLPPPPGAAKADKNLYQIVAPGKGALVIAAEQGLVYRSVDDGATWQASASGNAGSFWSGVALDDGTILLAGLGGKIYRSGDRGKSWSPVGGGTQSSIVVLRRSASGEIVGAGLDGVVVRSRDGGKSFTASQREDRLSHTAMEFAADGSPVLFSKEGLVTAGAGNPDPGAGKSEADGGQRASSPGK